MQDAYKWEEKISISMASFLSEQFWSRNPRGV